MNSYQIYLKKTGRKTTLQAVEYIIFETNIKQIEQIHPNAVDHQG